MVMAMPTADHDILNEAYERLLDAGPEFGGDEEGNHGLTNHGPMAVEVMCRRGLDIDVHRWLDRYVVRLMELPTTTTPLRDDGWRAALGGGARRVGDWTTYFTGQLGEHAWRDVLGTWWPRLLPGIAAGSTHGVIRVGHAVRTLRAGDESEPALAELGRGLAFWAARYRELPGTGTAPTGDLPAAAGLVRVPRLADQKGPIAHRLARLTDLPGWPAALNAVRAPAGPGEVPAALTGLIDAATLGYHRYGDAAPVLLVHTATAPNAILHTLPELPGEQWLPSFTYGWAASAAIIATYAPPDAATVAYGPVGRADADDALAVAAGHGDEHVLKFTDTAVEVFDRTGDPDALAAAQHAADLIDRP